jgi:hypothetical protein
MGPLKFHRYHVGYIRLLKRHAEWEQVGETNDVKEAKALRDRLQLQGHKALIWDRCTKDWVR